MLFSLGEPFSDMLKHLTEFDINYVELVDESQHALTKKRVNALKKIAHENGIEFTVHAPFVDINIASPNPGLRRVMLKRLERSLGNARQLRCQQWIFHSGWKSDVSGFYPNLDWQTNLRSIRTLLSIAKKLKVDISIENSPEPFNFLVKRMEDFALFYSELGSDEDIGMTLDIAHANTSQQVFGFIEKFAGKITHVHISDNDGKYDSHRGIGYGKVNWEAVAKALKTINYKGLVVLQSVDHLPESLQTMRKLFT
jgi:sugar phosphate isomerase/epimerase